MTSMDSKDILDTVQKIENELVYRFANERWPKGRSWDIFTRARRIKDRILHTLAFDQLRNGQTCSSATIKTVFRLITAIVEEDVQNRTLKKVKTTLKKLGGNTAIALFDSEMKNLRRGQ